jgi:transposase
VTCRDQATDPRFHGPPDEPDPQVVERPKRRQFPAAYQVRIVREADSCTEPRAIGALLRRESLGSSHRTAWRKQPRMHGTHGLSSRKRGSAPRPKPSARELQLEREKHKLEKELDKVKAVIEFQKKSTDSWGSP